MSTFPKETLKYLLKGNNTGSITQGLEVIRYILCQAETEIIHYFPWFEKMPSPYRQIAIERTRNMIEAAINKKPWKKGDPTTHKKILAAIILSQCKYHYDILHEQRSKDDFVAYVLDIFCLGPENRKDVLEYAKCIYLPGQIARKTAPESAKNYFINDLRDLGYKGIIEARNKYIQGTQHPDVIIGHDVEKIWHYVRNIPDSHRTITVKEIETLTKKIEGEEQKIDHIVLHRYHRNIFDPIFTDQVALLVNGGLNLENVIPGHLWEIKEKEKTLELVLRKESIGGTAEGSSEKSQLDFLLLEPYIGRIDFYEKLRDARHFPGIPSDINPSCINLDQFIPSKDALARSSQSCSEIKKMEAAWIILRMIQAITASTFKAKKIEISKEKKIGYYDYYYLPYPALKYIFSYFSCFDVHNKWFATVEFKREDFSGQQEGDLWINVPDFNEIEEYFKMYEGKEIITLLRLLKSVVYRYLLLTISLLSVTVGFKFLLIRVKKNGEDATLEQIGIEEGCLKIIGENFGCRPLYTKYISDFQYKPSQVRAAKSIPGINLDFYNLNKTLEKKLKKDNLFIGIDIGGTNTKVRFFEQDNDKLIPKGDLLSFKTLGGKDKDDHYSSTEKFVEYLVDRIGQKCNDIFKSENSRIYNNVYVGIAFPGPVFENQPAGISALIRQLDDDLISIKKENQIEDSHIDMIQKKVKLVEPLTEKIKEKLSKCGIVYKERVYVNMTNDGTAEGIGSLHKYWESTKNKENRNKKKIDDFKYIIVLKAGTGCAGAVFKRKNGCFTTEEGPSEFGKIVINAMRRPRSFEIDDSNNISSYILGKDTGGWPGIGEYISQNGLNHLLKFQDNEEMFGGLKDFTSEEIGKMIEYEEIPGGAEDEKTRKKRNKLKAKQAAMRLGYIIADTLATIKIIYRITDEDPVGIILSGGVLPRKPGGKGTGDIVIHGVEERLKKVHGILLSDRSQNVPDQNFKQWNLLNLPEKEIELELGCRGSVVYCFYKEIPSKNKNHPPSSSKGNSPGKGK